MTMPSSRINAQFATLSCGLLLTCRGKINNNIAAEICTFIQGQSTMNADFCIITKGNFLSRGVQADVDINVCLSQSHVSGLLISPSSIFISQM